MKAIVVSDFRDEGVKYLTFSNKDGKKWSIPVQNIRTGLEVYGPSGLRGKLLKKWLPMTPVLRFLKKIIRGTYTTVQLSEELKRVINASFGNDWECSVFWGTPCVDQKITIQIFDNKKILGYCKIGSSERARELFQHEKKVLDILEQRECPHVSRCLALEEIEEGYWVFVQSTEKKVGSKNGQGYGKRQKNFLDALWNGTKQNMRFEETDYYHSITFLKEHITSISSEFRQSVYTCVSEMIAMYQGQMVEWGITHRDFTPWNTCVVNDSLFVFDFEYALLNAPSGLDRWHYFFQSQYYEEKYDEYSILREYYKNIKDEKDVTSSICYLVDIISLYLLRGEEGDIAIANQRAKLLNLILENNKVEDAK